MALPCFRIGEWDPATFARRLLCLDDLNGAVLSIYNRDHNHGISLFYRSARGYCRFLVAERSFGLTVHSQQQALLCGAGLTH